MRLLCVNWVDYRDPMGRGGGVSVYQRNLIDALAVQSGVQVSFLAAGLAHDVLGRAPRVVPLRSPPGDGARRFQLVNSGVLAPSHADFGNAAQIDHPATVQAIADFIERTGPFDVIHYNNLEGLPASVLALAERWPGQRQILSLHNYYPFCPQVNLWRDESRACIDFDNGAGCVGCLPHWPDRGAIRTAYAVEWGMGRLGMGPGTAVFDRAALPVMRSGWRALRGALAWRRRSVRAGPETAATAPDQRRPDRGQAFADRRMQMVALINRHCDRVLCVSDRVRQIALAHGIDPGRAVTSYIGSVQAANWTRTEPRPAFVGADGTLRLAYLGYMRADKGFPFLLTALSALPEALAARLHLTVAARQGDAAQMAAMNALRPRLAGLRHVDGYGHEDLDALLSEVDLGLVPVMWEDNLPQVAMEMHARHIPILCSDRGGARELGNCPALVHRAGDTDDFARALEGVLSARVTPADYWRAARPPTAMAEHLEEILNHYRGTAAG